MAELIKLQTLSNGRAYDWCGMRFNAFQAQIQGVTNIEYSLERDGQVNPGAGDTASSYSKGNKKYKGKITLEEKEVRRIEASLLPGQDDITDIDPFEIIVTWGAGSKVVTDTITCYFKTRGVKAKQGDMNHQVDIDLEVITITYGK